MKKKKGLSEVVTSLIIILLVLVAIGVIWVVVQNLIDNSTGQINYSVACLKVDVDITDAYKGSILGVTGDTTQNSMVTFTLGRGSDSETLGGVKVIASNGTLSAEKKVTTTLTPIGTAIDSVSLATGTTWTGGTITLTAVPYFMDDGGNEQLCQNVKTFTVTKN